MVDYQMAGIRALILGAVIFFYAPFASGDDTFLNPPDISTQTGSPDSYTVYAVGDVLDVSWDTTDDDVDLVINQFNSPLTEIDRTPNSESLTTGRYAWKVTTDGNDGGAKFDLTFSNMFNFMVFTVNSTLITAQSAYFNISNATVNQHGQIISSSTSTSVTPLPTSSTSLITSTPSTSHAAATSSTAPSSAGSKGLSTGADVGIGVGIGVVSITVIIGVILWFLRNRKKRNAGKSPSSDYDTPQEIPIYHREKDAHANWSPPSELPTTHAPRSELPETTQQHRLPVELPS